MGPGMDPRQAGADAAWAGTSRERSRRDVAYAPNLEPRHRLRGVNRPGSGTGAGYRARRVVVTGRWRVSAVRVPGQAACIRHVESRRYRAGAGGVGRRRRPIDALRARQTTTSGTDPHDHHLLDVEL